MSDSSDFNPYAAPETIEASDAPIASGEFVIDSGCILCRDSIQLPAICLHSGRTDDLELRHKDVYWWNSTYSVLFTVVPTVLFSFSIMFFQKQTPMLVCLWMPILLASQQMSGALLKVLAKQPSLSITRLRINWFVSRHYADRQRRLIPVAVGLAGVLVLAVSLLLISDYSARVTSDSFLMMVVIPLLFLPFAICRERKLTLLGVKRSAPYAGMYQLVGAHKRFLNAVQASQQMGSI